MSDNFAAAVTAAVEPAKKLIGFHGFELFIFRAKSYAENDFVLNETPDNRSVLGVRQRQKWLLNTRQNKHSYI
jgi:hypothetical protein